MGRLGKEELPDGRKLKKTPVSSIFCVNNNTFSSICFSAVPGSIPLRWFLHKSLVTSTKQMPFSFATIPPSSLCIVFANHLTVC